MTEGVSTGGCHCGTIRYEVRGESVWKSMCFCHSCTRTAGAPVVAWAGFKKEQFVLIQGTIRKYQSSNKGLRGFCPECGTNLTYEKRAEYQETQGGGSCPNEVYVTTLSLDNPDDHPPDDYVYYHEKVAWFHPGEGLPQHQHTTIS